MTDSPFEARKAVYYLESIARNLKEFASVLDDIPLPSIGSEILSDNRDWLDCYIHDLRRANGMPAADGESAEPKP